MEVWTQIIASVGFPVAVSIYLLIYIQSELKKLTETILKLTEKIDKICN